VLRVERLQIGEGGDLIEDDGLEEFAGLDREVFEFLEASDVLAQLLERVVVEDEFLEVGQPAEHSETVEGDLSCLF